MIGVAFSPLSLFILGMAMADHTEASACAEGEGALALEACHEEQATQLGPLITSLALVAGKCLVAPLVTTLMLIALDGALTSRGGRHPLSPSVPCSAVTQCPLRALLSLAELCVLCCHALGLTCSAVTCCAAVDTSLSVAGLIYGSLPVTPAVFFFATEYGEPGASASCKRTSLCTVASL